MGFDAISHNNKFWRVLFQALVLAALAGWLAYVVLERGRPPRLHRDRWRQRDGFVALSYGGLSRQGGGPLMSRHEFSRHVQTFADAGYIAVTTEDIAAFFHNNAALPERALYLMFEGGRKDSAIYGQEGLSAAGMRATMFFHTSQFGRWTRTFMNSSEAGSLSHSPFWGVGSQGHEIYSTEDGPDGRTIYYLTDLLRNPDGTARESIEQFAARAQKDYLESSDLLRMVSGSPPEAYIFNPANSLDNSLAPDINAINRANIEKFFKLAFIREGRGYNHRHDNPLALSRIRVEPGTDIQALLAEVERWRPRRAPYIYSGGEGLANWLEDRGTATPLPEGIQLRADGDGVGYARLLGSGNWRNVDASVRLLNQPEVEQSIYLRASRESFVRLRLADGTLALQERIPGHGLYTLYSRAIRTRSPSIRVTLRNNRVWLAVNGETAFKSALPIDTNIIAGPAALEVVPAPSALEQPGPPETSRVDKVDADADALSSEETAATALFQEIRFTPILERLLLAGAVDIDNPEAMWPLHYEATGIVFPVPHPQGEKQSLAFQLIRAAEEGLRSYAALPLGATDAAAMWEGLDIVPEQLRKALWSGVIFSPRSRSDWNRILPAVAEVGSDGYWTAMQLDREQAADLATMVNRLPVDALILPPEASIASGTVETLRRLYPTILFLEPAGEAIAESVPE